MERQPDALKPDDEHKLETTASDARQETTGVSSSKHADFKKLQTEHRIFNVEFNPNERSQQKNAKDQSNDHQRIAPTSRRAAIGFNPVRDPYEQNRRASRE